MDDTGPLSNFLAGGRSLKKNSPSRHRDHNDHVAWGGREHHWPAFNVADSAICVGIALLFLDMRRKPEESPTRETATKCKNTIAANSQASRG